MHWPSYFPFAGFAFATGFAGAVAAGFAGVAAGFAGPLAAGLVFAGAAFAFVFDADIFAFEVLAFELEFVFAGTLTPAGRAPLSSFGLSTTFFASRLSILASFIAIAWYDAASSCLRLSTSILLI